MNERLTASHFRHVLGHLPTGVTVLTAFDGDTPIAMAANSVTSVSLDPPLILVCPARTSTTWPHIRRAAHFCVNVLGEHHEPLGRQFAAPGVDRFADVQWTAEASAPRITDAIAWITCSIRDEHDAGDHTIVVADVHDLDARPDRDPLVFFRGAYGGFVSASSHR